MAMEHVGMKRNKGQVPASVWRPEDRELDHERGTDLTIH